MVSTNEKRLPACLSLKRLSLSGSQQGKNDQLLETSGGGSTSGYANLSFEAQTHDQWCWAAVSTSLGNYYHSPNYHFTQPQIVCATIGLAQGSCSGSSYNEARCNVPKPLENPLKYVGAFKTLSQGSLSVITLRTELAAARPFVVGIAKQGQKVIHFVVICDYDLVAPQPSSSKVPMWYVCDPWAGGKKQWIAVDAFPSQYPEDMNTSWAETFTTTKATPDPGAKG